jgi:hypothetical protein
MLREASIENEEKIFQLSIATVVSKGMQMPLIFNPY